MPVILHYWMKEIALTNGGIALVDDADYEWLAGFRWSSTNGYVQAIVNGRHVYMHRLIMDAPESLEVDHINRTRHDNRRENLRLCTRLENCRYKPKTMGDIGPAGMSFFKPNQKWRVYRHEYGKQRHLGYVKDRSEAERYVSHLDAGGTRENFRREG